MYGSKSAILCINSSFFQKYRKIPKISPGAYIFQKPFLRGLSTEGNVRFKLEKASLIVGSEITVFALFYVVFEGNFPSTRLWGVYIWRGLFSEFYGICCELLLDILKISSENWNFAKYFLVRICLRSLKRAKKSRQNAKFLFGLHVLVKY